MYLCRKVEVDRYGDQPNLERSTVAGRPLEKRKANDQSAAGFWLATKIRKGSVHRIHFFTSMIKDGFHHAESLYSI